MIKADSSGKAPGVAGASIGKCSQPREVAVSKPCLAGKQTGVCSFPCRVTPALLPPSPAGHYSRENRARSSLQRLRARQDPPAAQRQAQREQLLLQ